MVGRSIFKRPVDLLYVVYFVLHIFVTCTGTSLLWPEEKRFKWQLALLHDQMYEYKDPLMNTMPYWFYSFMLSEALIQFPMFIVCIVGLCKDNKKIYVVMLIYAVIGLLTTLPCEAELAFNLTYDLTDFERFRLMKIYFPTVILPAVMLLDMLRRILSWDITDTRTPVVTIESKTK
ncbi:transmembrane protein 6/97 [Lipomyces arxii]|uniref:transmembrane protein 6/97 n=1 Tax=Lipomyces arxii TaxID=56418 RepID=UPI0034CD2B19